MTLRLQEGGAVRPETKLVGGNTGEYIEAAKMPKAAKTLQVPEQILQVKKQVEVTEEYIDQLIERLKPILQVELKDRPTNESETAGLVPLAEDIRSIYFRLAGNVTAKLDYILRSLEI